MLYAIQSPISVYFLAVPQALFLPALLVPNCFKWPYKIIGQLSCGSQLGNLLVAIVTEYAAGATN